MTDVLLKQEKMIYIGMGALVLPVAEPLAHIAHCTHLIELMA